MTSRPRSSPDQGRFVLGTLESPPLAVVPQAPPTSAQAATNISENCIDRGATLSPCASWDGGARGSEERTPRTEPRNRLYRPHDPKAGSHRR
jgi:hypothetical protein